MIRKLYFLLFAVLLATSGAYAQNLIRGVVTSSEDRSPISGAMIHVEGTTTGTMTNADGSFQIRASKGDVITVSFIGMVAQRITVGEATQLNFALLPDERVLESVVVTALGIKRNEKALGYSVQKVSGEEVQAVAGLDMATSLTGKVSGMLVKNPTDFAAAPVVTIRGEAPLLVIDGVPYSNMTLRDVSAENVESIITLKGATASALYGYRGAGGAIMITTKNGGSGADGISVSLATNTMFASGFLAIPETQAVYGRGTANIYNRTSDETWGAKMDGSIKLQWDPFLKADREYEYLPVGKDNFRNFLEPGHITNNTLSVAYQGKTFAIRNAFNWTNTKGQYPNSRYDKYSYTLGADVNLDKLKIISNVGYHKQASPNIGFNGYTSYDPMYTLLIWTAADYDVRDYKDYWLIPGEKQNFTYKNTHNNPYFDRYEKTKQINRDIFNASINVSYDILDWLSASLRSGIDFYTDREDIKVARDSYVSTGNTGAGGGATWIGQWTGAYATGRNSGYSLNNDFIITADKSFGDFNIEALIGGSIFYKQDDSMWGNTNGGISVANFFSLKASVNPAAVGSAIYKQQVNSIYARLALSWKSMIFVEGTVRNDWSSTLPESTRSYLYPSVSGSFVVSEVLPDATRKWLDMWKVRGSWTVSKTPPAIYATNTEFNITNPAWGSTAAAYMPTTMSRSNVKPQASSAFEVGTQAIFLKNRIMLDIAYYDKLMYDFLVAGSLSSGSGFTGTYVNSKEKISRRGWEITLNTTPVKTKDWRWDIGANWSKYARYYKELDEKYSADRPWVKVGGRVDAYPLYDYLLDPGGNHIYSNGRIQFNPYLSNYGWSDPDWIWGIGSTLTYKDFSLSFSFDGRVGGLANTMTDSYMWVSGAHIKSLTKERELDVATPGSNNFLGKGVKVTSGKVEFDAHGNVLSDTREYAPNDINTQYSQYVKDMHAGVAWGGSGRPADCYSTTFIKLREISLTYTLPKKFVRGWAKSASVSFVGQNVWMWAKDFKYSDPDGGFENFNDPSIRYLGFNIKLNF